MALVAALLSIVHKASLGHVGKREKLAGSQGEWPARVTEEKEHRARAPWCCALC